jgi:hypothetical protein
MSFNPLADLAIAETPGFAAESLGSGLGVTLFTGDRMSLKIVTAATHRMTRIENSTRDKAPDSLEVRGN